MRAALLVLFACGSPEPAPGEQGSARAGSNDIVTGNVFVDGKPTALVQCKTGHAVHTFVEVVVTGGKVRFEDQKLYWNPDPTGDRGTPLACTRLDRSWGGGVRTNGTAYWRGTLMFDCGAVRGDLTLDCGDITAEERAQLDKNRADALERRSAPPRGAHPGDSGP